MHTLSIFPELLTYGLLAPFLLRITVGVLILLAGKERYKKEYKYASILFFASSLFIIVGLYTQIAVIVAIACMKFEYWMERKSGPVSREKTLITLLSVVILISLLFTGPGFLAFDWPL